MQLKIGVNALLYSMGQDYRQTGVSRYIDRLLANMGDACSECEIHAFAGRDAGAPEWPRVSVHHARVSSSGPRTRIPWEQFVLPLEIRRTGCQVYHGTVNTLPLVPTGTAKVVTIHDLAFLRFPEQVTSKRYRYLKAMIGRSARSADLILVPSKATGNDLGDLLNIPQSKIVITPLGVDVHFTRANQAAIASTRTRFGLDRPFILSVGTIEPRKNLQRLVEAFAQIASAIPHDFVLVGPSGWLTEEIEQTISRANLADRIKRPGFVDDAGLVGLYSAADVVAIPSLYEGFGLPVLEAMACGAVVVTSNRSSLPEVAGDAAILVDPDDIDAIASSLLRALGDTETRERLSKAAPERAKTFTWARTAQLTADAYRTLA
jgi:glycosyltransferase involved in cell wall biosynthesis